MEEEIGLQDLDLASRQRPWGRPFCSDPPLHPWSAMLGRGLSTHTFPQPLSCSSMLH